MPNKARSKSKKKRRRKKVKRPYKLDKESRARHRYRKKRHKASAVHGHHKRLREEAELARHRDAPGDNHAVLMAVMKQLELGGPLRHTAGLGAKVGRTPRATLRRGAIRC